MREKVIAIATTLPLISSVKSNESEERGHLTGLDESLKIESVRYPRSHNQSVIRKSTTSATPL